MIISIQYLLLNIDEPHSNKYNFFKSNVDSAKKCRKIESSSNNIYKLILILIPFRKA